MQFEMTIYVTHKYNKGFDIKEEVMKRFGENDADDLLNAIEENFGVNDELCGSIMDYVTKLSNDELSEYISINENDIEVDIAETYEWDLSNGIAYSVEVKFDDIKLMSKLPLDVLM